MGPTSFTSGEPSVVGPFEGRWPKGRAGYVTSFSTIKASHFRGAQKVWCGRQIRLLEKRGLSVPDDVRAKLAATSDLEQLQVWLARALTSSSAEAIFED